jgi:hypothetical protein
MRRENGKNYGLLKRMEKIRAEREAYEKALTPDEKARRSVEDTLIKAHNENWAKKHNK